MASRKKSKKEKLQNLDQQEKIQVDKLPGFKESDLIQITVGTRLEGSSIVTPGIFKLPSVAVSH
jgi:hypothetical protein